MKLLETIALISVHSDPASETVNQNIYVRQLGEALSRLGWQVDMFTRKTDPSQARIVQHNPLCRTIRLIAGELEITSQQEIISYLPQFFRQLIQFQVDNDYQYSLIHTNSWLSAWVGMELKKVQTLKHMHTYHSLGAVKYATTRDIPNITKTRLAIENACLETADLTIVTCPQQRDYLRELVSNKGNVKIVPYGTDIDLFGSISRHSAKKDLQLRSDIFNILYVGKLDRISGIETLIEAVSKPQLHRNFDVRLTIVNNSNFHNYLARKRVEKQIEDAGIYHITTWVGKLNRQELATYYAASDVCVIPSHYNPSGKIALEAMASGTPVIVSNVGDLKYIVVSEQTGLLYPAQNSFLLTRAINRLASNPEMRLEFAVAARIRVEELFTWDIVADQINEFYLEQIEQQNLEFLSRSLQHSFRAS